MPFHATVKKDPQPEVVEVPEAMGHPQNLLHDEIHRLGRPVRCPGAVVGEYLRPPAQGGTGQAVQLGNRRTGALADEGVEAPCCLRRRLRCVHRPKGLPGQQRVEHLVARIAGGQAGLEGRRPPNPFEESASGAFEAPNCRPCHGR